MVRVWDFENDLSGSVHCLSDGAFCVYGKGPELLQVFGPPFSCGSVCGVRLPEKGLHSESTRIRGTNTWVHRLRRNGKTVGTFTDCMAVSGHVFMRMAELSEPLTMQIVPSESARREQGMLCLPKGSFVYMDYPSRSDTYVAAAVDGGSLTENEVLFPAGKSVFYLVGEASAETAGRALSSARERGYERLKKESETDWASYIARIRLPAARQKEFADIEALAEDVAVLIRAQQSAEGGVLAGYNYHLGYVRDQYGVYRCLMRLGLIPEAKKILTFFRDTFSRSGALHNAQAMGIAGMFHVHENDASEITGYLIVQTVDFYERTGDLAFFKSMIPLLRYCLDRQVSCLHRNMLPFNGDETYIAGGLLNRFVMDEGSAEATLLFVTGAERLFRAAEAAGQDFSVYAPAVQAAKDSFRKNFVRRGKLACNAPERRKGLEFPSVRHGVCVGCLSFGDLFLNKQGYDVCKNCKDRLFDYKEKRYFLPSVGLAPIYIGAEMFSRNELASFAGESVGAYKSCGFNPKEQVGYESGYLLYAMLALGEDEKFIGKLAEDIVGLADETGAWAEYYCDGKPYNTRCRPWESAINLEALLWFAEREKKN